MKNGISVIIPAYNREEFITETILSILNQNFKHTVEIILSDDGSTDGTILKVKEFGNKIKIIEKSKGCITRGVSGARNRGIQASTQPFICFLDSDDIFLPGHFEKMIPYFQNPDIGFVFCRSLEFKLINNIPLFKPWTRNRVLKNDIKNIVVSRNNIINTNCFLFRREVFNLIGCFNENYPNGEDADLWMRISEQFKGAFANHFGAAYRMHDEKHRLTNNPIKEVDQVIRKVFEEARKRYYYLNLKDQKRIFKLEYRLLPITKNNPNSINFKYHFLYFLIILRYPLGYIQKIIESYHERKENHIISQWTDLEDFI